MGVEVVWLKRDLRAHDHAPLVQAARRGPVCVLYIYEPALWGMPESDPAHLRFVAQSLDALDGVIAPLGARVLRRTGPVLRVLDQLCAELAPHGGLAALRSHKETGGAWTYARDRAVRRWCRERGLPWYEHDQDGVARPHPSRDGWAGRWAARMAPPPLLAPERLHSVPLAPGHLDLRALPPHYHDLTFDDAGTLQPGGTPAADALLRSFLRDRVTDYRAGMARPSRAWTACSRISPHLAWGTLSVRTAVHRTRLHAQRLTRRRDPAAQDRRDALHAFEKRLRWRGHFMQKLEDEPALERRDLHPATRPLRTTLDPELHRAWADGTTGWPMVDACMRALHAERWLPFRMRAMLVSVHSYLLWQPWQPAAEHLARLFLDFEPGIHYSQIQMQSGTTGINALRIYNPTRQARENDPTGTFIRRWVPELHRVPIPQLFEPHTLSLAEQREVGCRIGVDYPAPLVDGAVAAVRARQRIEAARDTLQARAASRAIHHRHGSRLPASARGWSR